jgi:hypothetical protein
LKSEGEVTSLSGISSPFFYFELGGHLGWKLGSTDTILEGGHPRIISAKFG